MTEAYGSPADQPTQKIKLQFAVPDAPTQAPVLQVPVVQDQPIAAGLATVDKPELPETRNAMSCRDMIPPDQQTQAAAEAAQLLPAMLGNTQVLMEYGLGSLKGVNSLIDRLMTEVRPADIGPLKDIMRGMTLEMKSIKGKYDLSTKDGQKSYNEWQEGSVRKWFKKARNYLQEMMADMQSIDAQLEGIKTDLEQRKIELIKNVGYLDRLYVENEQAIYQLMFAIAVMENIAEQARNQQRSIPDDDATTGRRNQEAKQQLSDLILQMDVKIAEYKGRLWVAWTTSPEVRMLRLLNVGMAEKLNEAVGLTIPTMKLAIVKWRTIAIARESAQAAQTVSDATNAMMTEVAAASANAATDVMRAIQTPTILPETVSAVTDSLVQMAENILTEVANGENRRAELETTMGQSKLVLDGSSRNYNEQVVNGIVGRSKEMLAITSGPSTPPGQLPMR